MSVNANAGYSGTPLPKKLGMKEGTTVMLIGAPEEFKNSLKPLPANVVFKKNVRGKADLVVWFVRSARELKRRVESLGARAPGIWICWPKKSSAVKTDVTQDLVRGAGLGVGLVDYKVCAINLIWSGLKFAPRRAGKS